MPIYMNTDGKLYQSDTPASFNHCHKPFVREEVENLLKDEAPQTVDALAEVLTFAKEDKTFITRLKKFNEDARKAKEKTE
jgi:hypothetical protein